MSEGAHVQAKARVVEADTTPEHLEDESDDEELLPSQTAQSDRAVDAAHDRAEPRPGDIGPATLENMLTRWSVADIKSHFDGNTETAATSYRAVDLLKSQFQSNWFRAKERLLGTEGGKNPRSGPRAARANAIMQGLHGLRALDMQDVFSRTRAEMRAMEPGLMLIEHLKQQRSHFKEMVDDPTSSLYSSGPTAADTAADEANAARKALAAKRKALQDKKEEMLLKWGSAGSTTITSDIDSNPKGAYSVLTVRKFNEIFRAQGGNGATWAFEPGTVYDINVYGQDYMGDWPPFDIKIETARETGTVEKQTMSTHQEVELGEEASEKFAEHQEMMSYLHVLKYIDHGEALDREITAPGASETSEVGPEWAAYKQRIIGSTPTEAQKAALLKTLALAEQKYVVFRKRFLDAKAIVSGNDEDVEPDAMLAAMQARAKGGQPGTPGKLRKQREDSVPLGYDRAMMEGLSPDRDAFDEDIIAMTASNRIYEQMEIEVIKAREAHRSSLVAVDKARKAVAEMEATLQGNAFGAIGLEDERAAVRAAEATAESRGLRLKQAMIDALYFANEVYMTQGAVQFAVLYKQAMGKDVRLQSDLEGGKPIETALDVPKELFLHSFTENVGDSLKELNHCEHAKDGPMPVAQALETAAKYLDRMMESAQSVLGQSQYESVLQQWPELATIATFSAAQAEKKANVDLRGTAELRLEAGTDDPVEKLLSHMRMNPGKGQPGEVTYRQFWDDECTAQDREALLAKQAQKKLDLGKIEANWESRSLDQLDAKHEQAKQEVLGWHHIPDVATLRALVIDFGAEVPKMYHKWLAESGTTFAKTGRQQQGEAQDVELDDEGNRKNKVSKLAAEVAKLDAEFRASQPGADEWTVVKGRRSRKR